MTAIFERFNCVAAYTPPGSTPRLYVGTNSGKIHCYDGSSWSLLVDSMGGQVTAMTVLTEPTGPVLVVGGEFGIGTNPLGPGGSRGVARYNGTTWTAMGAGPGDAV